MAQIFLVSKALNGYQLFSHFVSNWEGSLALYPKNKSLILLQLRNFDDDDYENNSTFIEHINTYWNVQNCENWFHTLYNKIMLNRKANGKRS